MYVRLSLDLSALTKATASRVPRVHGTSNNSCAAHPFRLTEKYHRSLDGERNSEALSQCVRRVKIDLC